MKTERLLFEIFDFLYHNFGDTATLEMGYWDEEEMTYYAQIKSQTQPSVEIGSDSLGTDTIEEALEALIAEMHEIIAAEEGGES